MVILPFVEKVNTGVEPVPPVSATGVLPLHQNTCCLSNSLLSLTGSISSPSGKFATGIGVLSNTGPLSRLRAMAFGLYQQNYRWESNPHPLLRGVALPLSYDRVQFSRLLNVSKNLFETIRWVFEKYPPSFAGQFLNPARVWAIRMRKIGRERFELSSPGSEPSILPIELSSKLTSGTNGDRTHLLRR